MLSKLDLEICFRLGKFKVVKMPSLLQMVYSFGNTLQYGSLLRV